MANFNAKEGSLNWKVNQGVGDIKKGLEYDDLSRISVLSGKDKGIHFGVESPTFLRHNVPFQQNSGPTGPGYL